MKIQRSQLPIIILALTLLTQCKQQAADPIEIPQKSDEVYVLVWSDEFDYAGLPDPGKWSYDVGDACDKPAGCGWGNNELQYYTESRLENARVEDGNLIIEAHKETFASREYTSARLLSSGLTNFRYGKVEVKAKLPKGKGTWSAIWMLPNKDEYGGWPKSGEVDIMEHVGYASDTIYGTVHTEAYNHMIGTQKGNEIFIEDADEKFHVYTLEWGPELMKWSVDNVLFNTFTKSGDTYAEWPFDQPFHLLLNLAIGGNWGGKHGIDDSAFPQQYVIDYVRIYTPNSN